MLRGRDPSLPRATSAPAGEQQPCARPDLSCSISMSQVEEAEHQNNEQTNKGLEMDLNKNNSSQRKDRQRNDDDSCSSGSIQEELGAEEPDSSQRLNGSPVKRAVSVGNQTTLDNSETTRELYKLVAELSSCQACESHGDCCRRAAGSKLKSSLLYSSREQLKLKDFRSEVRASMDVEQFAHQAELMLDMREVSIEDIVGAMLERVMSNDRAPTSRLGEAKEIIFVPGSTMLLAKTIQGMSYYVDANGNPSGTSYDQSWLCALCSLAQVSKRHMVVARFKQATNMADNAHEVRLFALMVTPSKEKDTKSALETGRTFATMFSDVSFRQRLLEAKSETEFKSLMMVRARRLSEAKHMKNRHKYMMNPGLQQSVASLSKSSEPLKPKANYHTTGECGQMIEARLSSAAAKQIDSWASGLNPPPVSCVHKSTSNHQSDSRSSLSDNNNNLTISSNGNNNNTSNGIQRATFCENPRAANILELIGVAQQPEPSEGLVKDRVACKLTSGQVDKIDGSSRQKGNGSDCNLSQVIGRLEFGKGLWADLRRRLRHYPSDFIDAFVGPPKTVQKTVATVWFLYFSILLPTIAFSALNTSQTRGHMGDLRKAIIGQAIGGLGFALLGGQPLVIIMTTAPLCLYTKVIHQMSVDFGLHFPAMYAAVGIFNGLFLAIYSIFGFSRLMKWCTRSTEETFALFIVIAFIIDATKDLMKNFQKFYYTPACDKKLALNATITMGSKLINETLAQTSEPLTEVSSCSRETSLLFVLLMLGTLWLATTLYKFKKTPYLEAGKRELLADYALPAAVIATSFIGSYVFDGIYEFQLERAQIELLPLSGFLISLGLGFTLSLLFFMDQNISAAMVNAPQNGLKKGCAYHLDLLMVGFLNGFLALYGFPMMHGVLPHSPLHVRSLADIEERVEEGHLREIIVNVRETRVTGIASHVLVLLSLYLIPYPIAYIPTAVLNGLFLFMAVTSLDGLQMFERILLLFTEQSKYPPNHYIRRCPQRKIHQFTTLQLLQLLVLCLFGFSPFNVIEMFFPVIILLMIPFRHLVVPRFISEKSLEALDGNH